MCGCSEHFQGGKLIHVHIATLLSFDDITSSGHDLAVIGVESSYGFRIPFSKSIHKLDVGCLNFCLKSCIQALLTVDEKGVAHTVTSHVFYS